MRGSSLLNAVVLGGHGCELDCVKAVHLHCALVFNEARTHTLINHYMKINGFIFKSSHLLQSGRLKDATWTMNTNTFQR